MKKMINEIKVIAASSNIDSNTTKPIRGRLHTEQQKFIEAINNQ